MLDELRIRGLGVIDEAVLPLGPGLTAVTGETGAGKTMVVTGLLLLFGGRADSARVRTGRDQASVDGRLTLSAESPAADRVRAAGGELDSADSGDELVLRRTVSASGRSRAYVGGAPAPVAVLTELADQLLAVHGQADQLRLVRPAAQRAALDHYAGVDLDTFGAAHARWRAAAAELSDRIGRAAELRRESDLLTHGIGEIEAAAPQPGELGELTQLAGRLGHADALRLAARTAHDVLLGDSDDPTAAAADVTALLAAAARTLAQQQGSDDELDGLAGRVTELSALAADLGAEFGAYADSLDTDPARLEQIEARRATLTALVRKYCDEPEPTIEGVLRWAADAGARLKLIDVSDEALAALRSACDSAAAEVAGLAAAISAQRREAAERLAAAASAELAGLAMPDARLEVEVAPRAPSAGLPTLTVAGQEVAVAADGADEVTLLLQPHRGAPALPVGRGASGGELSRVMLALEVCLAGTDPVPTFVFDEVDAGVGGRAAVELGRRLARLARHRQVLVVTHLPQVAAFADRQVVVDKPAGDGGGGVTASDVRVVDGDERVAELARMLAGSDSQTAREHAAELLADAARDEPVVARATPPNPRKTARQAG
ncbi:MAG TPA: DNA repair protein RecN [Jatrophihabitans sp.]|nr:DNA repair protein RecN [Jatrophihabitans sp.]